LAFTHIFSSDLTRARFTADAIADAQISDKSPNESRAERIALEILREQDFGSFECQSWASKSTAKGVAGKPLDLGHPDFKPKETHDSMTRRMDRFLDEAIHPLLITDLGDESTVAIVSHGIILSFLWKALLQRFGARSVSLGPGVSGVAGTRPLEYLPSWSNTGFLETDIKSVPIRQGPDSLQIADDGLKVPKLSGYQMLINRVNCTDHLKNLKRARGGLGSSTYDTKQKNLEGFFKKPRIDEQNQEPG
jgi:Histidine phosphatase superfamily (branch 1)